MFAYRDAGGESEGRSQGEKEDDDARRGMTGGVQAGMQALDGFWAAAGRIVCYLPPREKFQNGWARRVL